MDRTSWKPKVYKATEAVDYKANETQYGTLNPDGSVTNKMDLDDSNSDDPIAYNFGFFEGKSGKPMDDYDDLAPEYVRGYNDGKKSIGESKANEDDHKKSWGELDSIAKKGFSDIGYDQQSWDSEPEEVRAEMETVVKDNMSQENWKEVANKIYKEELNKGKKSGGESSYENWIDELDPIEIIMDNFDPDNKDGSVKCDHCGYELIHDGSIMSTNIQREAKDHMINNHINELESNASSTTSESKVKRYKVGDNYYDDLDDAKQMSDITGYAVFDNHNWGKMVYDGESKANEADCTNCGQSGVDPDPRFQLGSWCEDCQDRLELAKDNWWKNATDEEKRMENEWNDKPWESEFDGESKANEYYGKNEPDKLLITIRCEKCHDVIRGEFDIDVKRKAHDHLIDQHEYTWLPTKRKFEHDEQNRIYQKMISNMEYSKVNYSDNIFESKANEEDPCWKGYKQIGMKDKNGKQVPNCVPNSSGNEYSLPSMFKKKKSNFHNTSFKDYAKVFEEPIESKWERKKHVLGGDFYDFFRLEWNSVPSEIQDIFRATVSVESKADEFTDWGSWAEDETGVGSKMSQHDQIAMMKDLGIADKTLRNMGYNLQKDGVEGFIDRIEKELSKFGINLDKPEEQED